MDTLDTQFIIIFLPLFICTVACLWALSKKTKGTSFDQWLDSDRANHRLAENLIIKHEEEIWGLRAELHERDERIKELELTLDQAKTMATYEHKKATDLAEELTLLQNRRAIFKIENELSKEENKDE